MHWFYNDVFFSVCQQHASIFEIFSDIKVNLVGNLVLLEGQN